MNTIFTFGTDTFSQLTADAEASPRLRKNLNLHAATTDPANRLLNAMVPDSYVRPHRHLNPNKDESLVVVRGAFGLLIFDDQGAVVYKAELRAGGELVGCNIPAAVFHGLVSLEKNSVLFEVKAGPYEPTAGEEWASWAPAEGDPAAPAYLASLMREFIAN